MEVHHGDANGLVGGQLWVQKGWSFFASAVAQAPRSWASGLFTSRCSTCTCTCALPLVTRSASERNRSSFSCFIIVDRMLMFFGGTTGEQKAIDGRSVGTASSKANFAHHLVGFLQFRVGWALAISWRGTERFVIIWRILWVWTRLFIRNYEGGGLNRMLAGKAPLPKTSLGIEIRWTLCW